jgi:hypothetical protein
MSVWDTLSPAQWAILFGLLLIAVVLIAADLINDEPWDGFGGFRL